MSRKRDFIARTISGFAEASERALYAEETAKADGLLQKLDPRVKLVGLLALLVAAAMSHQLWVIGLIFSGAVGLALLSRVSIRTLATRTWIGVLLFSGFIALPAIFITPGARIPIGNWTISASGLKSAAFLVSRVETAATLMLLLILCTPWTHVLKALRALRVPSLFIVILGMTYRYIFLFLQTAREMFEARSSRMVGELEPAAKRRLATSSAGVLLGKSLNLSEQVYSAMLSRGFRGEAFALDEFAMTKRDWLAAFGFALATVAAIWLGRR